MEDIQALKLVKGSTPVFFAPKEEELTHRVFTDKLRQCFHPSAPPN